MILTVPRDHTLFPTLGGQVCDFIEQNLVFGPGDLRGQPAVLDDEKRAFIYRAYEVYPKRHAQAGRRRFKRVAISLRKGTAKTEFAAWIAACELHPEAPVRCTGFTRKGEPIGGPVSDPYIALVAYTEEQSEDLAYGALRVILELSTLKDDFIIGFERIERKKGDGKAVALASAPDARDGARTTFQHFDETHRFTLPRLVRAHQTMLANIPKRRGADAWSLETTTAPQPGAGSVAEATMEYARSVQAGTVTDARLFFFHREASDTHDLKTPDGVRAAVIEASGPVAAWSDIESIIEQWRDPTADSAYLERVWLNRLVQGSERAFDAKRWAALARPKTVKRGATITLGFDGSRYHDATALVGTDILTGFQFVCGLWERPKHLAVWEVPKDEVDAAVAVAFREYNVWRLYADPPFWEETVATWAGRYGEQRVVVWFTNRPKQMAYAVRGFANAITDGSVTHDGNEGLCRHVGNAHRRPINQRDDQGVPLWTIQKDRKDSSFKIDAAMSAILSWEARCHAVAAGVGTNVTSVYASRGATIVNRDPSESPDAHPTA